MAAVPARRAFIPKHSTDEQRPLSIPALRVRIVQAPLKIVLEPIFEAGFLPCSFGFRPKRSAHDAVQVLMRRITWRHGSVKNARNPTAAMRSRFLALRVRPANRNIPRNPDGSPPACWPIAEWPPGKLEPTDY